MKTKYTAPKVVRYGHVDTITQYIGKSENNDSFFVNNSFQDADGSCGFLNTGGPCPR